ncbi:MAG: caspase family protein, partial [Proteobacteria bacterium]|nr:caspase family protein [Pseudomonadota bacterium]
MKWHLKYLLFAIVVMLCGCMFLPRVIPISELMPRQKTENASKEVVFPVVIGRFFDERSNRNFLGQYDTFGSAGTVTIVPDRDISEVFEAIARRSLKHKGIEEGRSIFSLKGAVQRANVGAMPMSRVMNAEVLLELTLVDSRTGARLWQKTFQGVATGHNPKTTLALAFQDMETSLDKDDSILALKQTFLASGGKLPEDIERKEPEVKKPVVDIHNIPDFKATPLANDLAVVIGIENYQGLPKSDFSKSDAGIVKDYLKALGFAERNIEFVTDEKATKSKIETAIEGWLPNKVKGDSRIIVYYSGHGAPNPTTGEAFIVPYDGDPNYLSITGYPLKRLYDNLGKLQAAEVIVLLDTCFSGAGGRSVLAKGARPLVMTSQSAVLPQNMVVLSATQGSQITTSSQEKGHGIFTYYFLKALKNGKKSVAEIYEHIKPYVEDDAKSINVQQS